MKKLVTLLFSLLLVVSAVSAATADSVQKSITVDGDSSDWSGAMSYSISEVNPLLSSPSSSSDLSGSFRSAWDNQYVYFLVEITDDQYEPTGGQFFSSHDGIEVMIDGGNEKSTSYDANDFKLLVKADGEVMYYDGSLSSLSGSSVVASASQKADGYTVEVGVSWDFISGQNPSEGVIYGFDLAVNDRDGGSHEHQMMWRYAADHSSDTSGWHNLQLSAGSGSTSSQYSFSPSNLDFTSSSNQVLGISVSDTVVYDTGYYSTDGGNDWTQFSFSGSKAGNWVLSNAGASLSLPLSEVEMSGNEQVAFYACSWTSGWDCHGNNWQIRQFSVTLPDATNEPVCGNGVIESGEECEPGNVPTTCQEQLFDNGSISCTDSCTLNTSACFNNPPSGETQSLVQGGSAVADIVVASDAPSSVQYAAELLQKYILDMSGATLPIGNSPDSNYDTHVYIGQSSYTDSLGITNSGTRDGGYKIVSGDGYLVMLGDDKPYDHAKKSLSDSEWDAITAPDTWVNTRIEDRAHHGQTDIWEADGKGSINAVHGFLRGQGVRWYYPEDFGTIIPNKQDISFEPTDKIVNPDFPLRDMYIYFHRYGHLRPGVYGEFDFGTADEHFRFVMSLGLNDMKEYIDGSFPHGLNAITKDPETQQNHPEYYAVWDGVRRDGLDGTEPKQNLCSEGLKEETIRYVKTIFDTFDAEYVSIWPVDGFTRVSEHSQECLDKASPELGEDGKISNYVWDFINEVAWEVYDDPNYGDNRKIIGGAYSAYQLPPTELTDSRGLAPNIVVFFTRFRTWGANPEENEYYQGLVNDWIELLPSNEVLTYDYYLHHRPDRTTATVPVFFPQLIAQDLNFLAGRTGGEFSEIYANWPGDNIGYDTFAPTALNTWLTARLYWDVDQDVNALLNEYYNLYYGPAADTMRQLVEYSEQNIPELGSNPAHLEQMRQLAEQARTEVPSGSDYEARIDRLLLMINEGYEGASNSVSSCQNLESSGTTYTLTQDVSSSSESCFFLGANGITLDCQGYTINVNGQYGVRVDTGSSGFGHYYDIRNCNIQGSGTGIAINGADDGVIQDNNITTSGRGISLGIASNNLITRNNVNAGGDGIFGGYGSYEETREISNNVIEQNVFHSNGGEGAYLYRPTNDQIRDNTFSSDGGNGLRLWFPADVILENNIISSSTSDGLYAYQPTNLQQSGNTITNG